MTFLAHEIPWASVASAYAYKPERSAPGPQHADFYLQYEQTQIKRLEYFASALKHTIRAHAVIERKKYRPSQAYAERAQSWTSSANHDKQELPTVSGAKSQAGTDTNTDTLRRLRNEQLRRMQAVLSVGWAGESERRTVYPDTFVERYNDLHDHGRNFLKAHVGMDVAQWIEHAQSRDDIFTAHEEKFGSIWHRDRELADVVKLIITDASTTTETRLRKHHIDTLFLMAKHPLINLRAYSSLAMSCCNMECGFTNLAEYALEVFLLLNLIVWHRDNGVSALTEPFDETLTVDHKLNWCYGRGPGTIPLRPRPAYMAFPNWLRVIGKSAQRHEHLAETILFRRTIFPEEDGGQGWLETDLLSNSTSLWQFMKALWQIIIITEMIRRELNQPLNWEYVTLSILHRDFCHGNVGRSEPGFYDFMDYVDKRSADKGFDFRQYGLKDVGWPDGVAS